MTDLKSVKAPVERKAGVTFNYADCNSRVLHGALEKLDEFTGFSVEDLSRFMKIKNNYDSKCKEVSRLFKKLVDKHAEQEPVMIKDKDGKEKPMLKPNGKVQTKPIMIPIRPGKMDFAFKDKAAFNKDYQELMSNTFHVKAYLLMTEDLVKAGLTPKEIRACAKIISDIDPDLIVDTPIFDEGDEPEEDDDQPGEVLTASPQEEPSNGSIAN